MGDISLLFETTSWWFFSAHKLKNENANIDWENSTAEEIDCQYRAISELVCIAVFRLSPSIKMSGFHIMWLCYFTRTKQGWFLSLHCLNNYNHHKEMFCKTNITTIIVKLNLMKLGFEQIKWQKCLKIVLFILFYSDLRKVITKRRRAALKKSFKFKEKVSGKSNTITIFMLLL